MDDSILAPGDGARRRLDGPMRKLALLVVMLCAGLLLALVIAPAAAAQTAPAGTEPFSVRHQGETFTVSPASAGGSYTVNGVNEVYLWSNATASKRVTLEGDVKRVTVRARADLCEAEAPRVEVRLGGATLAQVNVSSSSFAPYSASVTIPRGEREISLAYTNDLKTASCDRNVHVDWVNLHGTKEAGNQAAPLPPDATANPIAGESLYVQPNNRAKQTADQWRSQGRTADAAQLDKIAATPTGMWFGGWNANIQAEVNNYVTTVRGAGRLPVMLSYNIPIRDCGSYSSGGAASAAEYRAYTRSFAAGIGNRKAVVVLEPDAIGDWGCLTAAQREERRALIEDAITVFKETSGAVVYVDIGYWNTAADSAQRLQSVGVAKADGFALNTSNFQHTADMVALGKDISSRIGGKHFVIDTGRGGLGPWTGGTHSGGCAPQFNPPGRALGPKPTTTNTPDPLVDALFWLKPPGDSDANCGGYPPAGAWMPEYALGLAQRAAY